ncbi:MAG: hypothetical protein ACKVOP_12070 [Sphingomonadaceae bacterium]
MFRGYRGIIIAAFGWLSLVGANESKVAPIGVSNAKTTSQGTITGKAEQSAPKVATAPKAPETKSGDAGCTDRKDRRYSDLCAQWKAADAAFDGARASERQVLIGWIGLVLGAVTMGAAIAAAAYAKEAAAHTKTGANAALDAAAETREANRIARQSLMMQGRPWLEVSLSSVSEIKVDDAGMVFSRFKITINNTGQSPALNVSIHSKTHVMRMLPSTIYRHLVDYLRKNPTDSAVNVENVFPSRPVEREIDCESAVFSFPRNWQRDRIDGNLFVAVNVTYEIPGSDKKCHSSVVYPVSNFYAELIEGPCVMSNMQLMNGVPGVITRWEE